MKTILKIVALLLLAVSAQAQIQQNNAYGYDFRRIIVRTYFKPPSDTLSAAPEGSIAVLNRKIFTRSSTGWDVATGFSGSFNDLTDVPEGFETKYFDPFFFTNEGTQINPYGIDTNKIATQHDLITAASLGLTLVHHDNTLVNTGQSEFPLGVDTSIIATQDDLQRKIDSLAGVTGGTAPDGSETKVVAGNTGISVEGAGTAIAPYVIRNLGAPGTNPTGALNILDFGAVANAVVGAGTYATGTNNTPALNAAIAAAVSGQDIIIPSTSSSAGFLFSTPVDTIKGSKVVRLIFKGKVFLAGNDFLRIRNGSGAFEQHTIIFENDVVGRINMPSHSKSGGVRSSPPWASFTGVVVKLLDVNQCFVQFNKVEGTLAPIQIIGGITDGAGAQENTIVWRWFYKNANGIILTSWDGFSFVDKNHFGGWHGGTARLSGGLAIKIDGFATPVDHDGNSGTAAEPFNGAFRSNRFHIMIEQVDSLVEANVDITEPIFDINVEGGTETGVLGDDPFKCRSVSPNYVRNPFWMGRGVYGSQRLGTGSAGSMGINAIGFTPIWNGGTYYGNIWRTDVNGRVLIIPDPFLTQSSRNGAQAYIKFESGARTTLQQVVTTSAAAYTVGSDDGLIKCNASGTNVVGVNLPAASSWPDREISIRNISLTGSVSVAGGDPNGNNTLVAGYGGLLYRSNGTTWDLIIKWHD
jgi:hypothetical protein